MTNVAAPGEPEDSDVTGYAVRTWGRTARLCAIRLAEAVPVVTPLAVWLILRR